MRKERKGVRRRSLYKSSKPFVLILCLLPSICSFSNWNNLFLRSKPHQLCGAVTKCGFILCSVGLLLCARQKMSRCREPSWLCGVRKMLVAVLAAGSLKEKSYQFALTLQCGLEAIPQASREKKHGEKGIMRKRQFMNLSHPLACKRCTESCHCVPEVV